MENPITINGHVIERGQVWLTVAGHVAVITRIDYPVQNHPIEGIIHITDTVKDELDPARAGIYHWNEKGEDRMGDEIAADNWSLERPLLNFEVRHLRMSECHQTEVLHPSIRKIEWLQQAEGEVNGND